MRRRFALTLAGAVVATGSVLPVASAQEEPTDDGLRIPQVDVSGYPEVVVTTTITAALDGPDRSADLQVAENGEAREATVNQVSSGDLEVVLLIDTTGSMGGNPMEAAKDAASTFVERLPEDTRLSVVGYDVETTVVTGFDASRDEHLEGIAGLAPDGSTAMYDAVRTTLDEVLGEPGDGTRQAIVVLTDGEDNASDASVEEVAEQLAVSNVTLQGVEYLTQFTDEAGIRTLSEASGGQTFAASEPDALVRIYEDLAADLVNSYTLRYASAATGTTELSVTLDDPDAPQTATRTIELPADAPAPTEEPATEPDAEEDEPEVAVVAPPPVADPPAALGAGRLGLLLGAVAWFVALALLFIALFAPRERRAQLSGTATRIRGASGGGHEVAERVTLVTEQVLRRRGYERGLNAALERAGVDLRPAELVVVVAGASMGAFAVGLLLNGPLIGILLMFVTVVLARLFVTLKANRRQAQFAEQLADTLQLLSGSLRAGYSLMQAIDAVAREADAPTSDEFGRVVVETRLGRNTNDAFQAMAERMRVEDFVWVMQAIQIHREVGGDLAEVLDTVGNTIRERDQVRRQVKALSAEGRLSGYVLLALPFAIGGIIFVTNRPYIAELTNGGLLGWGLIGMGALLMTVGTIWMRNLVKLEF
jgi:tight adherence protein B